MAGSTLRRAGTLLAAGVLTASLGTAEAATSHHDPAAARRSAAVADLCASRGPIQAADLAAGIATADCSLEGRVVVSGNTAVVVPPAGHGVGADGVSAAGGVASPSLEVTNMGGVLRASTGGAPSVERSAPAAEAARAVGACRDGHYRLESGGHPWRTSLRWNYQSRSNPARFPRARALAQIKAGMTNMRTGHNDCGLKARLATPARYLGTSTAGPNIKVRGGRVSCGSFNRRNVVGWGSLPDGLLGWTCYWWGGNNHMIGTDMRLSPSKKVVLRYPSGCSQKYDLQSLATHEWGHAWGLDHVANRNLTMHHFLPPCATSFRTLGLGDFRGMRKLYG